MNWYILLLTLAEEKFLTSARIALRNSFIVLNLSKKASDDSGDKALSVWLALLSLGPGVPVGVAVGVNVELAVRLAVLEESDGIFSGARGGKFLRLEFICFAGKLVAFKLEVAALLVFLNAASAKGVPWVLEGREESKTAALFLLGNAATPAAPAPDDDDDDDDDEAAEPNCKTEEDFKMGKRDPKLESEIEEVEVSETRLFACWAESLTS